jgi:hypothetical protein
VASDFGIGKGTVIKTLKDCHGLSAIAGLAAPLEEVIQQATSFISVCYDMKGSSDMSHIRLIVLRKRIAKDIHLPQTSHFHPVQTPFLKMQKEPIFMWYYCDCLMQIQMS